MALSLETFDYAVVGIIPTGFPTPLGWDIGRDGSQPIGFPIPMGFHNENSPVDNPSDEYVLLFYQRAPAFIF